MNEIIPYSVFRETCASLLSKEYRFAKTMPENPHWYTLRKSWGNDAEFDRVVAIMRQFGYREKFGKTWYTMFDVNGWKYWTMGAPIRETILINRRTITLPSQYDAIADVYDSLFVLEDDKAENMAVMRRLGNLDGRVLDIGCGSGLLLDLDGLTPNRYTGIDPSQKMLDVLRLKHPSFQDCLVHSTFESFYGNGYDLIVSLFGASSYVHPATLSRIPSLLTPQGRFFLMFYKPDYRPVTYQKTGNTFQHYVDGHTCFSGDVTEFGNYYIVEGGA